MHVAYTGDYTVEDNVVTHKPFASLFPIWVGADVPRRATIDGDTLTLDLLEPITENGRQRNGSLRWRRAAAE